MSATNCYRQRLQVLLNGAITEIINGITTAGAGASAALAGWTLGSLFRKRLDTAREILLEELRRCEKSLHEIGEVEEVAAITYRFARAAQEGTARLNLRLMAKVIAGQARLGTLVANEFLYYADIIASLRREEIILITTLHKHAKDQDATVSVFRGVKGLLVLGWPA